ncbi:hypothetical protein JOQ06_013894 [Pogonophryne albipinna]|uniref:SRCR domain-containing protein n=1 Tax=Pogonophryne albipinna TaxID=1090488 RepID=A0AAD6A7L7_9TELE|nr:hypothetical protein JOQ06_013894 [Pogonophryne albipinna]
MYLNNQKDKTEPDEVRLVGGERRCEGDLELKHQGEWRPVGGFTSLRTLKTAGVACRELDCGSAVSLGERKETSKRPMWRISSECVQSGSALRECAVSYSSNGILTLTCSDSVRLVGGTSLCSGRLEVNSNQSNPSWSSVCEADFDQQDAQVVCREIGCGAPSVLQGALYGEGEAPMGTKEFQCGGHESALLNCSSASERNTCSPGTAVSLTCSEPDEVRLVGGESRCVGDLELKHQGEWRAVNAFPSWNVKEAEVLCRDLDCGSAVFAAQRVESSLRPVWWIVSGCVQSAAALRECAYSKPDEVRLVGGESRCAGELEVKHQGEWRPVGGLSSLRTLKTAGVLCRDLDCGSAVFVGERKASSKRSVWRIRSDCVQSGSVLRDCAVSYSSNDILSLTCSDSVRLVGGTSPCSGRLEVNSNQSNQSNPSWSSVCEADFDQQDAQVVCRQLGCGAPSVLQGALYGEGEAPMWTKEFQCGGHESALLNCSSASERNTCSPGTAVSLTCSEPVRLVGGESRCAGELEVKLHGDWRPVRGSLWTLKTAGVACRDLDCGSAVSVGERVELCQAGEWDQSVLR